MIRKLFISAALIALTVGRVSAADGAPAVNTAPSQNWTGLYIGGDLGDAWGRSEWTAHETGAGAPPLNGSFDFYQPFDFAKGTGSYFIGLQAGYNYTLPSGVVLGVEADVSFPNTIMGTETISSPSLGQATYEEKVEYSGTVRGRLGYALGKWLLYGTGGYAWTDDQLTRTQVAGTPVGGTAVPATVETRLALRSGWVAGGGVETGIGRNWTADLEYLFTDFSSHCVTFPAGAQVFDADLTLQSIRLGLNYQLDGVSSKGRGEPAGPIAPNTDNWSVHAQTTYLIQGDPLFRSPYRGTNSLIPGQSHETWDATFYLGLRLWPGAEFWFNPEIDQGFGLSGTLGVAGFPSGEAYKVGDAYPYARIPRMFIRQTIGLGGGTEKVEPGANQFGGSQATDRLVFTLGKFAVTDVFDTNKYAHDPRTDWMNWALVDTGTFDYAADAWGYTYGAAVEWYQGPWTLRAGLFDLSIVPNSEELDPTFSQFQSVLEVERRYKLWEQPGKIAVTGFLSRGRMGTYDAAVSWRRLLTSRPTSRPSANTAAVLASVSTWSNSSIRTLACLSVPGSPMVRSSPTSLPTSIEHWPQAWCSPGDRGDGPTMSSVWAESSMALRVRMRPSSIRAGWGFSLEMASCRSPVPKRSSRPTTVSLLQACGQRWTTSSSTIRPTTNSVAPSQSLADVCTRSSNLCSCHSLTANFALKHEAHHAVGFRRRIRTSLGPGIICDRLGRSDRYDPSPLLRTAQPVANTQGSWGLALLPPPCCSRFPPKELSREETTIS